MHLPQNFDEKEGNNFHMNENEYNVQAIPLEPDFSEYMWMADEDLDEFDRRVIHEIDEHLGYENEKSTFAEDEEKFLQDMLQEEEDRDTVYFSSNPESRCNVMNELNNKIMQINVGGDIASKSTLNPNAAEFVPQFENSDVAVPDIHNLSLSSHSVPVFPGESNLLPIRPTVSTELHSQNPIMNHNRTIPPHLLNQGFNGNLNGHSPVNGFYQTTAAPVYVPNVPVYSMINGSHYVASPQSPYLQLDRVPCSDEDGY